MKLMTSETILAHLYELGVEITLSLDARSLELDARADVLTDELLGLVREHKDELVELVYEQEERTAIVSESPLSVGDFMKCMTVKVCRAESCVDGDERDARRKDAMLLQSLTHHPALVSLFSHLSARGGASVEIVRAA